MYFENGECYENEILQDEQPNNKNEKQNKQEEENKKEEEDQVIIELNMER